MVGFRCQWQYGLNGSRSRGRARLAGSAALAILLACVGCAGQKSYEGVQVATGPGHRSLTNEELVDRSEQSVAVVETDIARGLAFVVDPSGYLITNRHVVEDADHVDRVVFPAFDPPLVFESVQVIYTAPEQDLALLRVHAKTPLPSLSLAAKASTPITRYLRQEDPVVVLRREEDVNGAETFSAHNTEVTDLAVYNEAVGPTPFVGVSSAVGPGQSGGPILDRFGRVVGVVTWTWRDRDGGFAIPISDVFKMLDERPKLVSDAQHHDRAAARSRDFLAALGRGDVDDARRLTSPSHAREVRRKAVAEILGHVSDDGLPVLQGFLAAVETLVELEPAAQSHRLREIVQRTGTSAFREALGIDPEVEDSAVVSFFFELGQSYLVARAVGEEDPGAALETAMQRLQTVDAARTFALAGLLDELGGSSVEIERIDVVPGAYGRTAVVALRTTKVEGRPLPSPGEAGLPDHLTLHMKLEWGDWYVAAVGRTPLTESSLAG